jgi:uncharacterized protein Yka (UPF0111/DUF47 family)
MKARILKLVSELKETLREVDESGASGDLLDEMYDKLNQIEDEIYDDDLEGNRYSEDDEY